MATGSPGDFGESGLVPDHNRCKDSGSGSTGRRIAVGLLIGGLIPISLLPLWECSARAQDQVRNFSKPILRHQADGHSAPVRALIFAEADGSQLLSAGL